MDNVEDVLTPMEKPEEDKVIPCVYSEGFSGGTEVGKMINPETGEEVKIMANTNKIVNHENPGNIFRDHLEKGPLKGTIIPEEERISSEDEDDNDEYPYKVTAVIDFKFESEIDADLFDLLLDEITHINMREKVKLLKYIKELKNNKEEK